MKVINKSIPSVRLSEFISEIEDCLAATFYGDTFWITTEICDVNKKPDKRWCYLKLIEKEGKNVTAEIGAVFWTPGYAYIEKFEKETKQLFKDGLEITCRVKVTFHKRWGLKLEVVEIDYAYTLGKLEAERQETLDRLVKENPDHIKLVGEQYYTFNKLLPLPSVITRTIGMSVYEFVPAVSVVPSAHMNSNLVHDYLRSLSIPLFPHRCLLAPNHIMRHASSTLRGGVLRSP